MLTPRVDGSRSMEDSVQGRLNFGRVVVFGVVLVCALWTGAFGQPWDGNGVEGDPYQIWTAEDMQAIGADSNYWGAHFVLCTDINLAAYTGTSFNIIGNSSTYFSGVFDGNGHTISNFTYSITGTHEIGLFRYFGSYSGSPEIRDLGLTDANVDAGTGDNVGLLVGTFGNGNGVMSNCWSEGSSVSGEDFVGGLVGRVDGEEITLTDCRILDSNISGKVVVGGMFGIIDSSYAVSVTGCWVEDCNILADGIIGGLVGRSDEGTELTLRDCHVEMELIRGRDYGGQVGGLVGLNLGFNISNSYYRGDVIVVSGSGVGGLVGDNRGALTNCYSAGMVSTAFEEGDPGGSRVGGLVGYNARGEILDCKSSCDVFGGFDTGGLLGYNRDHISNCSSEGDVSGQESVGGLIGLNDNGVDISNCFSSGSVLGTEMWVGGLIGYNGSGDIRNCYSTSDVEGGRIVGGFTGLRLSPGSTTHCYSCGRVTGTDDVGGFGGQNGKTLSYTSCFWDSDVNPDINAFGSYTWPVAEPNVIGESTANMQTESTFTDEGWDFVGESTNGTDEIWAIREGMDYPKHVWTGYYGGNGTEVSPYLIYTAGQMNAIGAEPNDWDKNFKLMADIDLSEYTGTRFNMIGIYVGWHSPDNKPFRGVFDGNGHSIYRLTHSSTNMIPVGLFRLVNDPNARIMNLHLVEPKVDAGSGEEAGWLVGSLVGYLEDGIITNCHVEGCQVFGAEPIGGMVAESGGLITGCSAEGTVIGTYVSDDVGVLLGINWHGDVVNCSSRGYAESNWGWDVGGLVGNLSYGNMINCYSTADCNGEGAVGGLVGHNYYSSITNSYSSGNVSGLYDRGGLVGENPYSTITNCYSTGNITGDEYVGGLVGDNRGSVEYSFWDVNTSGQASSAGGTGKTTAEMQTESTYTDVGWDFVGEVINGANDIWEICEGTNYPKFVWQIPVGDLVCPDGVNFEDYAYFAERWYETDYGDVNGVELTGDGRVNWEDFGLFAGWWMVSGCGECGGADFTGEGDVDYLDLDLLAGYWLGSEYGDCGGAELTGDGIVEVDDLREFTENWLTGI